MANWAIVIGIDEYWTKEACLKGAVRDALNMRDWLLDPDGGDVPWHNVLLSLAPTAPSTVPSGLTYYDATKLRIVDIINRLMQRSGRQGERLFFYYAGHGIADPLNIKHEDALVCSDFTDVYTDNSFELKSILEYFRATEFEDQFFFIDACRNIPWDKLYRIGQLSLVRQPNFNLPPVQQYVFHATSPGVGAAEIREAGNERGAFTQSLLKGLKDGKGIVKAWDPAKMVYVVTVDSLLEFVKKEDSKRACWPHRSSPSATQGTTNEGRSAGWSQWASNPELARFAEHRIPREHLEVDVDPLAVVPGVEISIRRDGNIVENTAIIQSRQDLPATWDLPQREYSAYAQAANYQRKGSQWPVALLYEPQALTVMLVPTPPPSSLPPGSASSPPPINVGGTGGGGAQLPPSSSSPTNVGGNGGSAQLTVRSSDFLAPLEVANSTGVVLKVGQGTLNCKDLGPGFYRARFRSPDVQGVEQVIELLTGETASIDIEAPPLPDTRLTREVIQTTGFSVLSDRTLAVSAEIGPVGLADLTTMLTLAGSVANGPTELNAPELRSLGVTAFRDAVLEDTMSGVQLLFAVDSATDGEAQAYLSKIEVRLWPQSGSIPATFDSPTAFSKVIGLAQLVQAALPGRYWLALTLPEKRPIMLNLALLPNRLTMLVISREPTDQVNIFQYLPTLNPEEALEPNRMRQLEMFQRFYLSGQLDHAVQNVNQILERQWKDPIARCLAGYLLLRRGEARSLAFLDQMETDLYNAELSDNHVLIAEYAIYQGEDSRAITALHRALNLGLPIFADGLMWLLEGIQRYDIRHPLVRPITNLTSTRTRGLLWSAWYWEGFTGGNEDRSAPHWQVLDAEQEATSATSAFASA